MTQDSAYRALIDQAKAGVIRVDIQAAADAVDIAASPSGCKLLEVGCGSAYYSEIFKLLVPKPISYWGIDISPHMIAIAQGAYPELPLVVADGGSIPYGDGSFNIVFNGAALMHSVNYQEVIGEAARVSREWCIFHTVPLMYERKTTFLVKEAYGDLTNEVLFNWTELQALLSQSGLSVTKLFESVPYDLKQVVGEPTLSRTLLCKKVKQ